MVVYLGGTAFGDKKKIIQSYLSPPPRYSHTEKSQAVSSGEEGSGRLQKRKGITFFSSLPSCSGSPRTCAGSFAGASLMREWGGWGGCRWNRIWHASSFPDPPFLRLAPAVGLSKPSGAVLAYPSAKKQMRLKTSLWDAACAPLAQLHWHAQS